MSSVFISLGSNIEREANTRAGVAALRARYGELQLSSVYESEAVGFAGGSFYNMVIALQTAEPVEMVAQVLKNIEEQHGRLRQSPKFSSRTLDLDLLLYDDLVMHEPGIQIPRDEILRHAFVLWPLAEVAPDLRHPLQKQTYAELWNAFDKGRQQLRPVTFCF
ncbi:MAG: 2-amino-4-hydroxy-6-hydroxymethyldihydropteridine diphosphokinase [Pseudomonadota bacterium]|nr:2-amino-4-hydroxy-6-hydroxymethyldihydropteridine diphosphokinase [Pseudomonadota bacterium]